MKKSKHRAGFVTILGRPNAGKSTLLNTLLGTKLAIVASKPQTTRTTIQGVVTLPDAQIVFVDTPGIHKSTTLLNRRMMNTVRVAADAPDIALFMIDSLAPFTEEDAQAVDLAKRINAPVIAVLNKVDWLDEKPKVLDLIEKYRALHAFAAYVPISAKTGEGVDVLREEIVQRLHPGPALFPPDYLTDQPQRFLVSEIVREKVLHHTQQEVPHAVAVVIDSWEEVGWQEKLVRDKSAKTVSKTKTVSGGPAPSTAVPVPPVKAPRAKKIKMLRIAATIFVERPGQKAILIGAGGVTLKKIGTLARRELEHILDCKVFLQTFVKVRGGWRDDAEFLRAIDWR